MFDKDGPLPYEPPGRPAWENGPDSDLAYEAMMGLGSSTSQVNGYPKFMDGAVPNCTFIVDPEQRSYLQGKVHDYVQPFSSTKLKKEFPGSQPVSMDFDNLIMLAESQYWVSWKADGMRYLPVSMDFDNLIMLAESQYWVSWKADGMRYLVLINDENEVFAFDRDNNVFELPLRFPRHDNLDEHITDTLLDCEVTLDDQGDGTKRPRMLIYDIIVFQKQEVGKKPFNKRLGFIQQFIDEPRRKAQSLGKFKPEVMSVRLKQFCSLDQTARVYEMNQRTTGHHVDGLIFQPEDDPYTPGRFDRLLKWKPVEESSIDFKMIIKKYELQGQIPEYRADLYVLGLPNPFAYMKATKSLQAYDGKIVECRWNFERNGWEVMRERTDKSHPNAMKTAISVMNTIKRPLSKEKLFSFIYNFGFRPGHPKRLPPPPPNGHHNGRFQDRTQLTSMVL
uniref:mRNA guanylyltransferase n=1 Tax=Panagrolaimus sp. JU765 TaxID=591449 RepID=A0AC34QA70_9BILA